MYDLSYAIPSLLLMILFVGHYYSLPRIPNRMNRHFLMLITIECATIVSSIFSSWVDNNYLDFPVSFVYLANIVFFIMFYLRPYAFFSFVLSLLKEEKYYSRAFTILKRIPLQLCMLLAATTSFTGLIFTIDEAGYHSGPYYNILYLEFWFYVIVSSLIAYVNRAALQQKREKLSILWCNIILIVGILFRMYFPKVLLMNTFCLMAVTILYLTFENPDLYLERRTRIFNAKAFRKYLREINGKKRYRIFAFVIHNYHDIRELYGSDLMDDGINIIGEYLRKTFSDLLVFYYRDGRFVLVGDEKLDKQYEQIQKILEKRFESSICAKDGELFLSISSMYLNPSKKPSSYDTVLNVLDKALEGISTDSGEDFIVIDEEFIRNIEGDTDVKRALEQAIDSKKVEAFLQPIVDAKTGKVVGAEALARIRDFNGDIIPPGKFVPMAEKTGKISYVSEQVLDEVCRFINDGYMEKVWDVMDKCKPLTHSVHETRP